MQGSWIAVIASLNFCGSVLNSSHPNRFEPVRSLYGPINFDPRLIFFHTFALRPNASSTHHCRRMDSDSRLPSNNNFNSNGCQAVSLGAKFCLTNETQIIKNNNLTESIWQSIGKSVGLVAALSSQMRHNICKSASIYLTDVKYVRKWLCSTRLGGSETLPLGRKVLIQARHGTSEQLAFLCYLFRLTY